MKRFIPIFFLLCFLITNSGLAISAHWCGGKLSGINFTGKDEACACKTKKKKSMRRGCCKNTHATLKAKTEQQPVTLYTLKGAMVKQLPGIIPILLLAPIPGFTLSTAGFNKPPPETDRRPVYILHRTLLI